MMLSSPGTEVGLSSSAFAICFLVGCGVLAVWLDLRFPRLGPETVKATLLHVGGAMVVALLLVPAGFHLLSGSRVWTLVAMFAVAFPALTYALVVAFWVLKFLAHASRGRFR